MSLLVGFSYPGLALSPSNANVSGINTGVTVYAGVQFNTDGIEYKTNTDGGSSYNTSLGRYLDSGLAEQVWVQWTRTGGTLGDWNSEDSGDTRLQLSTSRGWRILRSSAGTDTIIGYFEFYNASSGGNLLYTTASRTFTATYST